MTVCGRVASIERLAIAGLNHIPRRKRLLRVL